MKKNVPVTNIGAISLFLVFIVLCMLSLAALSLSSAVSQAKTGERMTAHMEEYYAASNQAEELLATADAIFANAAKTAADRDEYYKIIHKDLLTQPMETLQSDSGAFTVTWQTPIDETLALAVAIDVLPPPKNGETSHSYYNILSWQVIRTKPWEGDDTLHFMNEQL